MTKSPATAGASDASANRSAGMPSWCTESEIDRYDARGSVLIRKQLQMDACVIAHAQDIKQNDPPLTKNVVDRAVEIAANGGKNRGYEAFNAGTVYWLHIRWVKMPPCKGVDRFGTFYVLSETTFKLYDSDASPHVPAVEVNWIGFLERTVIDLDAIPWCSLPTIGLQV